MKLFLALVNEPWFGFDWEHVSFQDIIFFFIFCACFNSFIGLYRLVKYFVVLLQFYLGKMLKQQEGIC